MPTKVEQLIIAASKAYQESRFESALELLEQAEQIDPKLYRIFDLRSLSYHSLGDYDKAIECMEKAIELNPSNAEHYYNLGLFYGLNGDIRSSINAHQECIKRDPDHVHALINLGHYFGRGGLIQKSAMCFRRAMELSPANPIVCNNYANILKDAGFVPEALQLYSRAIDIQPSLEGAATNICYLLQFIPEVTLQKLYEQHTKWDKKFSELYTHNWPCHKNSKDPDRKLRIGFISEDFREHPVGTYLISVFEKLDTEQFETYCYYLRAQSDDITERFKASAAHFVDAKKMSDGELSKRIQKDQIDILMDLSGHTSGNRLLVFARKPAPVQMTWLGYVGTTGVSGIDYKIGSVYSLPGGVDRYCTEKILRFSPRYAHQCYTPPAEDVPIGPPPSRKNGYVTFGTLSVPTKLNNHVLTTWAGILRKIPDSRLLLKTAMFESEELQESVRRRIGEDIDPERIIMEGSSPHLEAVECYNRIDIALDPYPFSGCTTTCEALWMGVPVITLPGEREASRHTVSFLQALELTTTVAMTPAQYQDIAVALAEDEGYRANLRKTLRQRFIESPVCDASGVAEELGSMFRQAWIAWCNKEDEDLINE